MLRFQIECNINHNNVLSPHLTNLVWEPSKHDVYPMSHFSVIHWSSLTYAIIEIHNLLGHVAPFQKNSESLLEGFTKT
uniref:Uncharacterized protein n=1 Tax=Solanum lycopersicum TaxID=4081 RepID=A0A3Q7EFL4_SOLLC